MDPGRADIAGNRAMTALKYALQLLSLTAFAAAVIATLEFMNQAANVMENLAP